jgi:hypothetical protein
LPTGGFEPGSPEGSWTTPTRTPSRTPRSAAARPAPRARRHGPEAG